MGLWIVTGAMALLFAGFFNFMLGGREGWMRIRRAKRHRERPGEPSWKELLANHKTWWWMVNLLAGYAVVAAVIVLAYVIWSP